MKYIVKNCGCLDDMKRCWSSNRTTKYCIDNDCLIKQVIEKCKDAKDKCSCKNAHPEIDCFQCTVGGMAYLGDEILQLFEIEECEE